MGEDGTKARESSKNTFISLITNLQGLQENMYN
jgi:hypothetical protein